jgi:hypothetical protein
VDPRCSWFIFWVAFLGQQREEEEEEEEVEEVEEEAAVLA